MTLVSLEDRAQFTNPHVIALSNDDVRARYANMFSDVRLGRVLEVLDIMAERVAWSHVQGPMVTAALGRMDLLAPINGKQDLILKGALNYTGKTSLEVGIRLENEDRHISSAYFTMVAIDATGRPTPIAPYVSGDEVQQRRHASALQRKQQYLDSLVKKEEPFTQEEMAVLGQVSPEACASMYRGHNLVSMYPQNRNMHNKVFGGHLMRVAFELAWDTVYEYSGERPILASIDRINFYRPVEIGALLRLHRTICYVGNTSVNVEIEIEETNGTNPRPITNSCYFTFIGMDKDFKKKTMPKVKPVNALEEKKYIEGYRRYLHNRGLKGQPQ